MTDVHFIDIYKVKGMPVGVTMDGYQIKAFAILMSSFEEVLWLDADSIPLTDPEEVFELKLYQQTGALFWPDTCVIHTTRLETWDLFGLPRPSTWPSIVIPGGFHWSNKCYEEEPLEIETGQVVLHKQRIWAGLIMTVFINRYHDYFLSQMFHGDKQTFSFGFNYTDTAYSLVRKHPFGVGRAAMGQSGTLELCSTSFGQRHPVTGEIMFLHRGGSKYENTFEWLSHDPVPRAWTHIGRGKERSSWELVRGRNGIFPEDMFLPKIHTCAHPTNKDMVIIPVTKEVR